VAKSHWARHIFKNTCQTGLKKHWIVRKIAQIRKFVKIHLNIFPINCVLLSSRCFAKLKANSLVHIPWCLSENAPKIFKCLKVKRFKHIFFHNCHNPTNNPKQLKTTFHLDFALISTDLSVGAAILHEVPQYTWILFVFYWPTCENA
jgi:hypothetical protein